MIRFDLKLEYYNTQTASRSAVFEIMIELSNTCEKFLEKLTKNTIRTAEIQKEEKTTDQKKNKKKKNKNNKFHYKQNKPRTCIRCNST